jgi:hypothetical protein
MAHDVPETRRDQSVSHQGWAACDAAGIFKGVKYILSTLLAKFLAELFTDDKAVTTHARMYAPSPL